MKLDTIDDLKITELRALFGAEKRWHKALARMAKSAASDEVREALSRLEALSGEQAARLRQALHDIGCGPRGRKSAAMKGILADALSDVSSCGEVRDAAYLAVAVRVGHYLIAAYSTALALGQGEPALVTPLARCLKVAAEAIRWLLTLAESRLSAEGRLMAHG